MRRAFYHLILTLVVLLGATACRSFSTLGGKKAAQGAPYELLVVCNGAEWEGAVGDALRKLLQSPVEMTNQYEPLFKVLRVTASDFQNILPAHRNILKVVISPEVREAAIKVRYDVESAPQVVMTFQAPSVEAALQYLDEHGQALPQALEMAERDRTIRFAERHSVAALNEIMLSKFGVIMHVPKGYELRSQSEDFVWCSHEFPAASQGFFAYSYPYRGKEQLSVSSLVAMRNSFARRIPGPSEGSYMTTVERIPNIEDTGYVAFEPDCRVVTINGRRWIELRGLWDVEHDFMGGPFVSYTTIDAASGRLFTIDGYVYSPKLGKRNFLRAVEHLVYLISFPAVDAQR